MTPEEAKVALERLNATIDEIEELQRRNAERDRQILDLLREIHGKLIKRIG